MRSSVRKCVRNLVLALALAQPAGAAQSGSAAIRHHFAANGNFDETGRFAPAAAGFDIADVVNAAQLETLPPAVKGLMWIGLCDGVDGKFVERAGSALGSRKLFGFYLMDDPDPSGRWREACSPDALRAEADWIHLRRADALVFVGLMNIGDARSPAFDESLRPERTHIDLFGVAPYPCRSEWPDCDDAMIGRFVAAARQAGVPDKAIVPIYQTFGGGNWRTDSGGGYRMPRPDELKRMLRIWTELTPAPVFDFAYSWGPQHSDDALGGSPALQSVFREHNGTK